MKAPFPEVDFSFCSSYVRMIDGDNGDNCLCLVYQPWINSLIQENKRSATFDIQPRHPSLTDWEVELLLNQPQSFKNIGEEWSIVELHRIAIQPDALVLRHDQAGNTTNTLSEDLPDRRFLLDLDIQTKNSTIKSAEILRKFSKSIQSILHQGSVDEASTASDVIRTLCSSVLFCPFLDFSGAFSVICTSKCHPNILAPIFVAAVLDHFIVALPYRPHTLLDCLRFTSDLLSTDAAKYFVLFQILKAMECSQQAGFFNGNLALEDFVVRENLWIQLKPVAFLRDLKLYTRKLSPELLKDDPEEDETCKLSEWTTLWCLGKISNYDYLLALNNAAGRAFGHPDYHPIMPWVVDFTSPIEGFRDLTKSKYRLTKGDHQLDLTYEAIEGGMVPHHIPETFSDLTFYIYKARQMPKSVLCQHVRKRWVPAEYPSTLERLYKWSPDECIPEFYSDPYIFISVHDDLPNLGLPYWCSDVQNFIQWHRAALESDYVSRQLHHWIDLNFGYKLSGMAAVAAKNVVLSLQVKHHELKNHGIQQLFSVPHPPRFISRNQLVCWKIPTHSPKMRTKKKNNSELSISEKNADTISVGGDVSDDAPEQADTVSVSSIQLDEDLLDQTGEDVLEDLKILELLIDFSISVDLEQPRLLEDFVSQSSTEVPHSDLFRQDVQAFACLTVEIFCAPDSGPKAKFTTLAKRSKYIRKLFTIKEHQFSTSLANALRGLLSSRVIPFSACQLLNRQDELFPFPKYMENLHHFLAESLNHPNLGHLETVLEEMDGQGLSILEVFLVHLLQNSSDRYKLAYLLLDPVAKYFTADRISEIFLPILHRLYSESPTIGTTAYTAYLMLFEQDLFVTMIIRLGIKKFLHFFVVALIEKLADADELISRYETKFSIGEMDDEQIFTVDEDDNTENRQPAKSSNDVVSVETAQSKSMALMVWLAEKVGPTLTSKFIITNLLKSLSLCYVEEEKRFPVDINLDRVDIILKTVVVGDISAWNVCDTIFQISELYGSCIIWDQCFSYCAELVKEALRKLTPMNEAGLLGCMEMISQILPLISEESLRDHLPFQIINEILYPVVELITSFIHVFPSGPLTRRLLTTKWLNLVYSIATRIGRDSSRVLITEPLLVKFFAVFTQLHGSEMRTSPPVGIPVPQRSATESALPIGSPYVTIRKDKDSGELTIGTPVHIALEYPPSPTGPTSSISFVDNEEILGELSVVFTESFAYEAYIPLCKLLGQFHMDEKLLDHDLLHEICVGTSRGDTSQLPGVASPSMQLHSAPRFTFPRSSSQKWDCRSGDFSFAKNASNPGSTNPLNSASSEIFDDMRSENPQISSIKEMTTDRNLRGNWLAYWQWELGQSRREEPWNIKQIPLQTFGAHSASVKSLYVFDSEYAFMSGSKDKTVRLWSIRNTGDGNVTSQADGIYLDHKKSIFDLKYLTRERLAASCDGTVILWDPWTLATVKKIELATQAICIDCSRAPSSALFIGHFAEETCFVSRFDVRNGNGSSNAGIFRVSSTTVGLIRCLVTSPDNSWFACGFSSGVISVFDQRTGIMSATWKPHESDIIQLIPASANFLISVGPDNALSVWDLSKEPEDRLVTCVRGVTEPITQACFAAGASGGGDLIAISGSNRVSVIPDLLCGATSITGTKIRHDSLRGNFSSLAILPNNRQILVGHENGSSLLLC